MTYALYSTLGCHLCEQAESLFTPIAEASSLSWHTVEISERPQWVDTYGLRIPVIQNTVTGAELGWPFDETTLEAWLKGEGAS